MKVKISETVEVTDQQRADIGRLLGKKQATRDECRDFIWKHGADWANLVARASEYQDEQQTDLLAELL
jgi:hypothetical protein